MSVDESDLFISYAREDSVFVGELVAALERRRKDAWVDWEGIRPGADWRAKIEAGIEAAKTFVPVISPELVASTVCREELAHAVASHKRIIPILHRQVDPDATPPELTTPNWIFFREGDDFDRAMGQLVEALESDLEWLDEHARLLVRATEWERERREASFLLRGSELRAAEEWLAHQGEHKEAATPLQSEYILASRVRAARTRRIVLAAVLTALLLALGLAAFAFLQRDEAISSQHAAHVKQSQALAGEAIAAVDADSPRALRLAVEAADAAPTAEAEDALRVTLANFRLRRTLRGRGGAVRSAAFSHRGDLVVTGSDDGAANIWDLANGGLVRTLGARGVPVTSTAFSPDGALVVAGSYDGAVRLWNVRKGTLRRKLPASNEPVYDAAFSTRGDLLVTAGYDGAARIWRTDTGRLLRTLRAKDGPVFSAAFSPDGTLIVTTSGYDGNVRLWNTATGRVVSTLGGYGGIIERAEFSADGTQVVAAGSDGMGRIYEVRTGRLVHVLKGHEGAVFAADFSPDGSLVVTAGSDGTARLWDTEYGRLVGVLPRDDAVRLELLRPSLDRNGETSM